MSIWSGMGPDDHGGPAREVVCLTCVTYTDNVALAVFPAHLSPDPGAAALAHLRELGSPHGLCVRGVTRAFAERVDSARRQFMPEPVPPTVYQPCVDCGQRYDVESLIDGQCRGCRKPQTRRGYR